MEKNTDFLKIVFSVMLKNCQKIWNTDDIFSIYVAEGGTVGKSYLIGTLLEKFSDTLIRLSSPTYATMVAFKILLTNSVKHVDCDDDDLNISITKIGKKIAKECILFKS